MNQTADTLGATTPPQRYPDTASRVTTLALALLAAFPPLRRLCGGPGKTQAFQPFVEASWIRNSRDFGATLDGARSCGREPPTSAS
ncbi:hypothetical protein AB4Z46_20485 [Variovorax sp. M-6]|uniref:hypothetical protein n=1 Tax=Variovorax sp. M-6 TaxID=3233041 RepID=UPI003F95F111